MFPEQDESDCEELPVFLSVVKPTDPRNSIRPLPENQAIVICSSDSEDSFLCSPARKKPYGPCHSVKMGAPTTDVRPQLTSESDEEEELVPLAERLQRKLLVAKPSTTASSFTRIQTKGAQESTGKNSAGDEEMVPACWQETLPADSDVQGNRAPRTLELSDSEEEEEVSSWDAKPQPLPQLPVCISDNKVQDGTHQISLKPFPLQTNRRQNHQELDKAYQPALQKRKEQGAQKQLQQQEKERRVALAQLRKAQRPEQCLKHIQIVLDPGISFSS